MQVFGLEKTQWAVAAAGLMGLALAGCADQQAPADGDQGIGLRIASGDSCIPDQPFTLNVYEDAGPDSSLDGDETLVSSLDVDITGLADADDFNWPTSGTVAVGDTFQVLPAGNYIAEVISPSGDIYPLDPTSGWQATTVTDGQTTEVVFLFGCEGDTIGALDGTVIIDQGPDIIDWEFPDSKETPVCGTTHMTGTFDEPTGDAYYTWCEITDPTGTTTTQGPAVDGSGNLVPQTGESIIDCSVYCDGPGTYDVAVFAQDADEYGVSDNLITQFNTVSLCIDGGGEDVCYQPGGLTIDAEAVAQTATIEAQTGILDPMISEARTIDSVDATFDAATVTMIADGKYELQLRGFEANNSDESTLVYEFGTIRANYIDGTSNEWALWARNDSGLLTHTFTGDPGSPILGGPIAFDVREFGGIYKVGADEAVSFEIASLTLVDDADAGTWLEFNGADATYGSAAQATKGTDGLRRISADDATAAQGYDQQLTCDHEPEALDAECAADYYGEVESCDRTCP